MKRSIGIALVVGAGLVVAARLADRREEVMGFTTPEECRTSGAVAAGTCDEAFAQARAAQEREAPRFASIADCEAEFGAGRCQPGSNVAPSMSNSFVPLMAGVMIGRALSGGGSPAYQPLYRRAGSSVATTSRGVSVGLGRGVTRVPPGTSTPSAGPVTVQRGGFGSTSRSVSTGSGG